MPASRSAKITIRAVESLKPGETIRDPELRGFIARRQDKAISYALHTRIEGRLSLLTIGKHGSPWTPDTARAEAKMLLGRIEAGENPAAMKRADRGAPMLDAFCEEYLADHARPHKKPKSIAADESLIRWHLKPLLGKVRVKDITRADALRMQRAIAKGKTAVKRPKDERRGAETTGGPIVANRALSLLSKMMGLAEAKGLRPPGSNPCRGIAKHKETKRRRYLSPDEMKRLGDALAGMQDAKPYFVALVRLLLLTGARRNEIATAQWDQVDWRRGKLILDDSKSGQKEIALPPPALDLLRHLDRIEDCPWIIPSADPEKPLSALSKPWAALLEAAEIEGLRIHDLRHSFAAVAVSSGLNLPVIGGILGHNNAATTKRYAHLEDDLAAVSAAAVAARVQARLEGRDEQPQDDPTDPATTGENVIRPVFKKARQ